MDIDNKIKYYSKNQIISWHEIDNKQLLRPAAFMNMAQEIANNQASALKFGYYELIALNQVWVLSRIKIRFFNPPKWGDEVRLTTWHKGMQAFFGVRDFTLHKVASRQDRSTNLTTLSEPELCAAATSLWVIINTETRKIERNNAFSVSKEAETYAAKESAIDDSCGKLAAPKEARMIPVGSHKVTYSDVDFNHHANNAKYIEWIMDLLPHTISLERIIKAIQINYISEAKLNDTVEIYMDINSIEKADSTIYLHGSRKGESNEIIFQAEIEI